MVALTLLLVVLRCLSRMMVRVVEAPSFSRTKPLRCVAYIRFSTFEQKFGYSYDAQLRGIKEDVERRGWVLVAVYADAGRSGRTIKQRPEFRRMIADAALGEFDVVVVHKLDRFSRNLKDAVTMLDVLENTHHVQVRSVLEDIDPTSPFAPVIRAVLLALAETFSRNLSIEVKKAHREMYEEGRHIGSIPFGYVRENVGSRKTAMVPGPRAEYVREIFALYASGDHSMAGIAALMNDKRRASAGSDGSEVCFKRTTVRYILTNPIYVGTLRYQDDTKRIPALAIVDEETFAEVQRRLKSDGRRPVRIPRAHPGFLLTGLLTCARCKGKLDGQHADKQRRYYRDRTRAMNHACDQPMIKADVLDTIIVKKLNRLASAFPADATERIRTALDSDDAKQEARATRTRLQEELCRLDVIYQKGRLSLDDYEQQEFDLKQRIFRCEQVIDLALERSLQAVLAAIQSFPKILPYDDADAMRRLNNDLRRVFTTLDINGDEPPCPVWSQQTGLLFDLLGVDPGALNEASDPVMVPTMDIEGAIGAYVQLPLLGMSTPSSASTTPRLVRRRAARTTRPDQATQPMMDQSWLFDEGA